MKMKLITNVHGKDMPFACHLYRVTICCFKTQSIQLKIRRHVLKQKVKHLRYITPHDTFEQNSMKMKLITNVHGKDMPFACHLYRVTICCFSGSLIGNIWSFFLFFFTFLSKFGALFVWIPYNI